MNPLVLVLLPALVGAALVLERCRPHARALLLATALAAAVLGFAQAMLSSRELWFGGYVRLDATSRLFLALINPIFLGVSVYVSGRLTATPVLYSGLGRFVGLALTFLGAAN